jgi:hypothetical protein
MISARARAVGSLCGQFSLALCGRRYLLFRGPEPFAFEGQSHRIARPAAEHAAS